MTTRRAVPALAFSIVVAIGTIASLLPAHAASERLPLAIVGEDTVTTRDLEIQLNIMRQRMPEGADANLPPADSVLRRLIQNLLITQEGYRMGLHDQVGVRNQVTEALRSQSSEALLDSVANTVPETAENQQADRRAAVKVYIDGLLDLYEVEVDSVLLRSLDYATNDEDALQALRENDQVLAVIPTGPIKVKNLSRAIRFKEYHGLASKPDAAERRDLIFYELLVEALVRYEARRLGFENHPEIQLLVYSLERQLVLEETLNVLLAIDFSPTDAEVQAFYEAHIDEFTPEMRIRLDTVKLTTEEAAITFRERLVKGTKLSWLRKNTPEVVPGPPPFPRDLLLPSILGIAPEEAVKGNVLDPIEVPEGWVVAVVEEVVVIGPTPLDECRSEVLNMMKNQRTREHATEILTRLEEATEIRILPDAEAIVTESIVENFASE